MESKYPAVLDKLKVGEYSAYAFAGGGYVWDEVLEYRVWCHPEDGAEDLKDGDYYYYYTFTNGESAMKFYQENNGTESPLGTRNK